MSAEQLFDYHVHIDDTVYHAIGDREKVHDIKRGIMWLSIFRGETKTFSARGSLTWCCQPQAASAAEEAATADAPPQPAVPYTAIETTHGSIRVGSRVKHLPSQVTSAR